MKLFVFGLNWNSIERKDEQYLTTIKIPAKDYEEAVKRLVALVGKKTVSKCFLNDYYEY